jgi:dihydrofolate reductase
MRKIIYAMSVSLDGYIEAPGGDIGWTYIDEELHSHFNEQESKTGIALYGRHMYELMSAYWPTADEDPSALKVEVDYARIWKNLPKVVFSTTLDKVEWNARLVKENMVDEVNKLKQQSGKDMSVGGAGLAASLMQLDLIDEFWLYVDPIILGGGKPMFPQLPHRTKLQLLETHTFTSGVILLKYQKVDTQPGVNP